MNGSGSKVGTSGATPLEQAGVALRAAMARIAQLEDQRAEPIAIVGMACRLPRGIHTPASFWRALTAGEDLTGPVPSARAPLFEGKSLPLRAGWLDNVDEFDAGFFAISPREARRLDPQQRLALEVTWEALEDAGIPASSLSETLTGIFAGITSHDYQSNVWFDADQDDLDIYAVTGTTSCFSAGRLAHHLGTQGPCFALDTACSSSLVALHEACQSLRVRESSLALAVGVNLVLTPETTEGLGAALSPDGQCRAFDDKANGFARAEGCVTLVLKRLSDCKGTHDRIWAVIRGSAINHDGRAAGLTAPNALAQVRLIRQALQDARLPPSAISMLETHGTGTPLGDPIEFEAIDQVFSGPRAEPCVLGAVKTNVGHAEAASGLVGVMKAALALHHEAIPRNLHFERLNRNIPWDGRRFVIPEETRPWPRSETPRRVGVNSFGMSGTNAHVVLEEAPLRVSEAPKRTRRFQLFPVSARSSGALARQVENYAGHIEASADAPLGSLARVAARGREHFEFRCFVVADTHGSAAAALRAQGASLVPEPAPKRAPKLAALFSGQGSQWARMGRELYLHEPVYRAAIDTCADLLRSSLDCSLVALLNGDLGAEKLDQTRYTQPALFAVEYALSELWRSWGVVPDLLLGHSVGEYVAACVAGVMDLPSALQLIAARGRLMQELPAGGAMLALTCDPDRALAWVSDLHAEVSVAAFNGPRAVVLSGKRSALERVAERSVASGAKTRWLHVSHAFHSQLMEPMLDAFAEVASNIAYRAPTRTLISNLTGDVADPAICSARYWVEHVRAPVRFHEGMQALVAQGAHAFLEMGPNPTLLGMGADCVDEAERWAWVPSLRRGRDDCEQLLNAAGRLYQQGVSLKWTELCAGYPEHAELPRYAFERQQYWVSRGTGRRRTSAGSRHPLLEQRLSVSGMKAVYESTLSEQSPAYLAEHRVAGRALLPATAYLELVAGAATELFGERGHRAEDVSFEAPMFVSDKPVTVQLVIQDDGSADAFAFRIASRPADETDAEFHIHVRGRLCLDDAAPQPNSLELAAIEAHCSQSIDLAEFYGALATKTLEYGLAFRGLRKLRRGASEALSEVALIERERSKGYRVHPALLDAATQTMLCFGAGAADHLLYLPVHARNIRWLGSAPEQVIVHARLKGGGEPGAARRTADILLCDENGKAFCVIEDYSLQAVDERARVEIFGARVDRDLQYELTFVSAAAPSVGPNGGSWLVLGDASGLGAALSAELEAHGASVRQVFAARPSALPAQRECEIAPDNEHDFAALLAGFDQEFDGIVHLWGLDAREDASELEQALALQTASTLHLFKALANGPHQNARVFFVGRGAQALGTTTLVPQATQGVLLGQCRALRLEYPNHRCVHIDIELESADAEREDWARKLWQELAVEEESEVVWRQGSRYVTRLSPFGEAQDRLQLALPSAENYVLEARTKGLLESLRYVPAPITAPGPGEVRLRVLASGLNFRDVLNVLGMYPGEAPALGCECVGIVEEVGSGVEHTKPGDEVMGIGAHTFGRFVTLPAEHFIRKPQCLSTAQAATIPATFLTALYGMRELARLERGQSILIHAAAGGVGMAAVQLALRWGLKVYATASRKKWDVVRAMGVEHVMDSRTADFADEVWRLTAGQGVDAVLNSLTGEALARSLALVKSRGYFLEMGKAELFDEATIAQRHPGICYRPFDLSEAAGELTQRMLRDLVAGFEDGSLQPLPNTAFAAREAAEAFRWMAQAKHTGKIVIRQGRQAVRANACYLVTGGLGGLGLRTAQALVASGARDIVLVGRRAPRPEAEAEIAALRAVGARIDVEACDVSDRERMAALFAQLSSAGRQLRGVVHAAGELHDGTFVGQNWHQVRESFVAKVRGAEVLDALTRELPLDFFLLYSSVAAVLGSPGQVGYAAANGYLDALAHRRWRYDGSGLSINWGAWSDIGMAARLRGAAKTRLADKGIIGMPPERAVQVLRELLDGDAAQVMVASVDWARYLAGEQNAAPLLARWQKARTRQQEIGKDLGALLAAIPVAARQRSCMEWVREHVRSVLQLPAGAAIGPEQALKDIGIDSLMAVELRNRLSRGARLKLPAGFVYDQPNIRSMADELLRNLGVECETTPADTRGQVPTTEALSDQDVFDELARELNIDCD